MSALPAKLTPEGRFSLGENERWYVVRTLPQREAQASLQLANQHFRAFMPLYLRNRRHARRLETVSVPLFPRYLFVALDVTKDRWRSINGTFGVDRLLALGGEPQPVPAGVVERLVDVADPCGNIQFNFDLKQGQKIKVTAGPFADFLGQLEELDGNGRVKVLLDIMGTTVRLAMPQVLVEPVSPL